MFALRNTFARSEQWRVEWAFRNCISVALVAFLYLYGDTKHTLTQYGIASTSFATIVTSFVKDVTLGATLTNSWGCILGAFIASVISWLHFTVIRMYYVESVPYGATIFTIFVSAFILQYLELVPITKKFACGMIPLNIIGNRLRPYPNKYVWGLFMAVLIGAACSIAGCVLPLPIRLASTELRSRISYFSEALSSVMHDISQSWIHNFKDVAGYEAKSKNRSRSNSRTETRGRSGSRAETRSRSNSRGAPGTISSPKNSRKGIRSVVVLTNPEDVTITCGAPRLSTENIHWRKLRLAVRAASAFRRCGLVGLDGISYNPMRKFNTRYIRMELVKFLNESLPFLQSRNLESGFGLTRRVANRCAKFVKLAQYLLLIITKLETHMDNMEKATEFRNLYMAFFARPNMQYGLSLYAGCISEVVESIARVLVVQSVLDDQLLTPGDEGFRAVDAAARLIRARAYFDSQYLQARKDVFHAQAQTAEPADHSTDPVEMTDRAETKETESQAVAVTAAPATPPPAHNASGEAVLVSYSAEFNAGVDKAGLRAHTKAMMDVNSILFLLDTMSRLLTEFWSTEDLVTMSQHDSINPSDGTTTDYEDPVSEFSVDTVRYGDHFRRVTGKFVQGTINFLYEIFPTRQSHLFNVPVNPQNGEFEVPKTIRMRLKMALKVAIGMVLGATYGLKSNVTSSPALVSLSIAFMSGGAVSGISVMTALNRSAGTGVACTYAIAVTYIVSFFQHDWERDLFIGFAVVLLQFPATYVRSFPLYSYSGIVTGFTIAWLLLGQSVTVEYQVSRIIDTYVGILIHLAMELTFAVTFTEDELVSDMKDVFAGMQERFVNFHRNFQFFKAAEDATSDVHARIRGGALTGAMMSTELQRVELLRLDMRKRKDLELDSIQTLIRRQDQMSPYYRAEPAVLRPAVFPTSLLEESVQCQQQALDSIQIMIWAVRACDGSYDSSTETMIKKLDRKIRHMAFIQNRPAGTAVEGDGAFEKKAAGVCKGVPVLPEFKTLLLPLEPHFINVERFVSAVLAYLSNSVDQIGNYKPALKAFKDPFHVPGTKRREPAPKGSLLKRLSSVTQARHSEHMDHATGDFPVRIYGRITHGKNDAFDSTEVDQLYATYARLIEGLQYRLTAEDGDVNVHRIPTNREMMIVNTLLTSTQQLIAALHGLSVVVSRMQAHRDIHVTQDGKEV